MNSPTVRSIPLSSFWGRRTEEPACLGAETFEHQYFIAKTNYIAVYKSHRAVCSFIEVVQNTYGTASPPGGTGRKGGDSPRVGRHGAEGRPFPGVLVPRGRGFGHGGGRRLPLRQGARSSHHVHHGRCHPRGHGAGGARCQPRSHPSSLPPHQAQPPLPPAPAPGAWSLSWSRGRHRNQPGTPRDGKWKRSAGMKRLKKPEMKPGATKGPPLVSVSYND